MPPKNRYTKEQIIQSAIEIVREKGAEEVTARSIASKLGCSVAPIFSAFENMEQLQAELIKQCKAIYYVYVNEGLKESVAFRGVGRSYIKFSMEEPNLFKLLFMSNEHAYSLDNVLSEVEVNYEGVFKCVQDGYGLNYEDSKRLYQHMWIYTHGIAVLCVTGTCTFTSEEITNMLNEVCRSLVKDMRNKND
ncbi:MAG: TetR/AcrR family transcriptional regulator [Candidatus Coproplasma sp.]